jgi:3-phenylpropionate/trans-cinnamate dioxygenase ferredoxin subunit
MAAFVKVVSTTEIPEGQLKGLAVGPHRIVVAHTQDGFYAVNDECTHESRPLRTGTIHDGQIMCQAHGARFDLKTGAVMAPPAIVPLEMLETKIEGDFVYVLLED